MTVSLIKFIGLYAASIATCVAYFVVLIYRYIDIKKNINIKFDIKTSIYLIIASIIVCISYYINNTISNIIILVCATIFCIILNKNNINFVISFLRKKLIKEHK